MQPAPLILLIDEPHPVLIERLTQAGFDCLEAYKIPRQEIFSLLPKCIGVVLRSRIKVDKEFIESGPGLQFIAREGVGVEHIDLDYAQYKGIEVITSPEGSRDTVAEHTLVMLLALLNKTVVANNQVKSGKWQREPNRAVELKGKTVGIIGYGNMGSAVARRLSGFSINVLAYDKFKEGYSDGYAKEATLPEIFDDADIVSLHIPLSTDNLYFVDEAFLKNFKKKIWLINTARGPVVNTTDLVENLKQGKILGAALDVLEYEEGSFNFFNFQELPEPMHYLLQADNVILSPHIAGWSFESKLGHAEVLARKIIEKYGMNKK